VNRSRIWIDTPEARTVGDLKHLADSPHHPIQLLGDVLGNPEGWVAQGDGSLDCTFYKGVGTAIQDVMTADLVFQKARELGIGTEVDMS
jgi:ornithine cyclodeaminase/alanine dehydrogenase-like protein (mu-crystallin family)